MNRSRICHRSFVSRIIGCRDLRSSAPSVVLVIMASLWVCRSTLMPSAMLNTLPAGTSGVATVPLFNVWTLWWNTDRALNGFQGYWDAPIFFPEPGTFAFSEPQPASLLAAPIFLATGSLILASKFYLLLNLILNGVFAMRLLRRLHQPGWIELSGSLMIVCLPIVHQYNDVVQLMPVWGILWTWERLFVVLKRPSKFRGILLGAAAGSAFFICIHHGLFMSVLLLFVVPLVLLPRFRPDGLWKKRVSSLLIAIVTVTALTAPFVLPMHSILTQHGFQRSGEVTAALSATLWDYAFVPESEVQPDRVERSSDSKMLNPGWVKLTLAGLGTWFGLRRRRTRQQTAFLAATCFAAGILSMAGHLQWGAWNLWGMLSNIVPGFSQVRNVFRFAWFVQLSIVLLCAIGLQGMRSVLSGRLRSCRLAEFVVMMMALIALIEVLPSRYQLASVPDIELHRSWINVIRREARPGHCIACFPMASGNRVRDFEVTAGWMYLSTAHGRPLVDGYSGFFPDSFFRLQKRVNSPEHVAEYLEMLVDAKVDLIVVDRRQYDGQKAIAFHPFKSERFQLDLLLEESDVLVFRLTGF